MECGVTAYKVMGVNSGLTWPLSVSLFKLLNHVGASIENTK